jgi:MoaA/NifB/PqqE/SkfB family radical SAM enzyme
MIVVWRVTEHCNLSCGFCAYDRRLERSRSTANIAYIKRLGAVLARHQAVSGDPILVSWLGGEPLLWAPLAELTRHFTTDLNLAVSTTTNGTTLHLPTVRDHLLSHYRELTISVDALNEKHDALRGSPGLFARVRAGVQALAHERNARGAALKLRANVVLMRNTVDEFPALCRELSTWGIQEISFNNLGGRDRPEFFAEERLLPAQAADLRRRVPTVRRELAAHDVTLLGGEAYLNRIVSSSQGERLQVKDCGPGQTFLFIDELGRVSPCSFTSEEYGVKLDELVEEGRGVAELGAHFRKRRQHACATACDDCPSTHVFTKFEARYGN